MEAFDIFIKPENQNIYVDGYMFWRLYAKALTAFHDGDTATMEAVFKAAKLAYAHRMAQARKAWGEDELEERELWFEEHDETTGGDPYLRANRAWNVLAHCGLTWDGERNVEENDFELVFELAIWWLPEILPGSVMHPFVEGFDEVCTALFLGVPVEDLREQYGEPPLAS